MIVCNLIKLANDMYDLVIIGAGPAGLTAAYELSDSEKKIIILEKKKNVGGLAETKIFGNFSYDIGPHRFFTKNREVNDLFMNMLGNDAVQVKRKTRILFQGKYFDYPLTPVNALFGLGLIDSINVAISYIFSRIKSYLKISKIENFEDWIIDKFGYKLYSKFFKNYTEKVWGIDCTDIGKDWASQRIKGLNLMTAIRFAIFPNSKKRPKTLVSEFYYPKKGAGMLWDKFENYLNNKDVEIQKNSPVVNIKKIENTFEISYLANGETELINAKNIFFSNPLLDFIQIYESEIPETVIQSTKKLEYRNHISVHMSTDRKLFDDNWIYIHSPDLKVARIADFSNFSEEMSPKGTNPLTLEYFCYEKDEIWNEKDKNIINLAIEELRLIFDVDFHILDSHVTKNAKAYPVIKTGYQDEIKVIKDWLQQETNLTAIGRSGMFKYNNQDHAMATGLYAARNYLGNGDFDPWNVNIDGEYHEEDSPED